MTYTEKLNKLLGLKSGQLDEMVMQDYFDWCIAQSYENMNDTQNLLADGPLCKFWLHNYLDVILDFLDHCQGMNPMPYPEEAKAILRIHKTKIYGLYNKGILNKARTKSIISYEPN